jgi:hypothetical protein
MSPERSASSNAVPAAKKEPRRGRRTSPLLEQVDRFLAEVKPDAAEPDAQYVREMIVSAIRLLDDRTSLADLKLLNASLRELRSSTSLVAPEGARSRTERSLGGGSFLFAA